MKVTINKSETRGKIRVPSSKSLTIRGLMCGALTRGESEIVHPLVSEDTKAAAEVLGKIGVGLKKEDDIWRISGGRFRIPSQELYCGESATTLRFMTAICSLIPGTHRLVGGPSLSKRPVKSLVEALKKVGIKGSLEGKTTPPVTIEGGTFSGGLTELPGNISSQFISALLLIGPFSKQELSVKLTTPMTSKPYVLMTIWCLKQFGINVRREFDKFVVHRQRYKPTRIEIEGDWSSASYFLSLGATSQGVEVQNISTSSLQGDRVMLDFLRTMGAVVRVAGNSITVSEGKLKAIEADLTDCIDLLPTMAVLAALADGQSVFTGIERARIKESNRIAAVRQGLERMDIPVVESSDRLVITGLKTPKPAGEDKESGEDKDESGENTSQESVEQNLEPVLIDSHGDHRIAMAFSVLGAAIGGVTIDGAECVAKTYPEFWETLKAVGVEFKIDE